MVFRAKFSNVNLGLFFKKKNLFVTFDSVKPLE